ncbi:RUN and FYVE domain-containing protein 2 isoform X2 [Arctopsyche grandis]|uniref:RUN and FYVE domain-containing protein 2 isoform X2 n=1 Tax=Arctopsyche grandis TaxID=121162 RepID=UPI00406D8CB0
MSEGADGAVACVEGGGGETGVEGATSGRLTSVSSAGTDIWPELLVSRPGVRPESIKLNRDPVVIERSNLVNISKLVVKELIEQSLRYGRMLDTDHLPLRHFFIVLEHVLRHGLKPKKVLSGLLGPKKELWDILQMVEKFAPEAQDITASVRDLPTVRTAMGRARAWLRLALMQKKLADYLRVLLEHRDQALAEYFEPHALVLSDEAVVIMGLLLGLNVIDCNLCVKEEDLDSQQGVIDFSLYLRGSGNEANDSPGPQPQPPGPHRRQIAAVLDQKNYIEELNRHLNATVANLQAKVEALTTTNALMKEDLAISKNNMIQLYEENNQLKHALGQDLHPRDNRLRITEIHSNEDEEKVSNKSSNSEKEKETEKESESELHKVAEEEKSKRRELQKELELQMCLKAEMEVAMKLLEKDIHDKQDTIVSLRRQLDDIKLINLEMYRKLQVCESSLKHKTEVITKLEEKTESMGKTIEHLDEKLKSEKEGRIKGEEAVRALGGRTAEAERSAVAAESDLRIEREWRVALQETMMSDREKISELNQTIQEMKSVETKNAALEEELDALRKQFAEAQIALEEVGDALSSDKLKVAELMERVEGNEVTKKEDLGKNNKAGWASDSQAVRCKACDKDFNLTRRKHHCRRCGEIFCGACSETSVALEGRSRPVRVCDKCSQTLSRS